MQYGLIEACDLVGFPYSHGAAFQEVADAQNTVLVSRELGMYATGLVEEGYASKGYHNKTKTCAWGPMAGFVLADPHFGKASATEAGIAEQAERIFAALNKGARTVPVLISDFRRQWLEAFGLIRRVAMPSVNEIEYVAQPGPGVLGEVAALRFILRRMWGVPDAPGRSLVCGISGRGGTGGHRRGDGGPSVRERRPRHLPQRFHRATTTYLPYGRIDRTGGPQRRTNAGSVRSSCSAVSSTSETRCRGALSRTRWMPSRTRIWAT
jgi:hypothetical protein